MIARPQELLLVACFRQTVVKPLITHRQHGVQASLRVPGTWSEACAPVRKPSPAVPSIFKV